MATYLLSELREPSDEFEQRFIISDNIISTNHSFVDDDFTKRELRIMQSLVTQYANATEQEISTQDCAWENVWLNGLGRNNIIPHEFWLEKPHLIENCQNNKAFLKARVV